MMKTLRTIAVLALFFAVLPFASAESTDLTSTTTTPSEPTRGEILHFMQHGELQPGVTYKATFSEDEINKLIVRELESMKVKWFIDRGSVSLNGGDFGVVLHMLRPISGNLEVNGSIEVQDGNAVLKVNSAWYGYFPVPASFVERVGNFILKKKSISEWFSIEGGYWESVDISRNKLSFEIRGVENQ